MRQKVGEPTVKAIEPKEVESAVSTIQKECEELRKIVESAYLEGVTLPEAEKLAARFLYAQMMIAEELAASDLDARMRKNGYKTMRAKVYLDIVNASEKKPTEAQISAQIDSDKTVATAQDSYERAEVHAESLQRYLEIFKDSHIYMRGIAKGRFE